jgi:iron complex outermembrane receptor protein
MRHLRIATALIALALLDRPAATAQDRSDLANLPFEELVHMKVDTVVGASKYTQLVTDAPASVTVVTAEEIQRRQYRSISDLLRTIRGFYVTNDRNYEYVGTRGFIRPGDYNSRILVLVDGHRLNDSIYGSALIGQEFPLDLEFVERVEVIRGPGSALYGSSAMFGVINVITKRAPQAPGGAVSALGGDQRTMGMAGSYGHLSDGGTSWLAGFSAYRSAGVRDLYFPELADSTASAGHAYSGDRTRRINGLVNITRGGFTVQSIYGLREKLVPTGSFDAIFDDPRSRTLDGQAFVDLSYNRSWSKGGEIAARVFADHYGFDGYTPYPSEPASVINHDLARADWWGTELRASRRWLEQHRVTAGFELRDNYRQLMQNFDVAPYTGYLNDARDSDVWSLYVEDEWRLGRAVTIEAGVRSDSTTGMRAQVNPRGALILKPAANSTFKLLHGRAFRAPTVYELYWRQADVSKPNPDLRSERMASTELAFEQYVGSIWRVSANAFHYRLHDLVNQTLDPADDLLVYQNLDAARATGIEVEVDAKWSSGVRARASQTLQRSRDPIAGTRLSNSPVSLFQASLAAPVFRTGALASMDLQTLSSRRTLRDTLAPAYTVANVTLSAPSIRRVNVSVSVWNLLGRSFADPGAEEHRQTLIPQDGRTVRVKARVNF